MKKVLIITLVCILAFSCVSAFAFNAENFEATRINDFEDANGKDAASEGLTLATDDNAFGGDDFAINEDQAGSKTAYYVKGVKGADGQCIKVTNSFVLFPDVNFTNYYNNYSVSCDIMPKNVTSFAGLLADYRKTGETEDPACDPHPLTETSISDENCDIAFDSGWGFTFLKTSDNSIRVFTNYDEEFSYLDIDLGLGDIKNTWHTYTMYRLCNNTEGVQTAFIFVDYKPAVKFEGSKIYDLINDTSADCTPIEDIGTAAFCFLGAEADGTAVYFDNLWARDNNHTCSTENANWAQTVNIEQAFTTISAENTAKADALVAKRAAIAEAEKNAPDTTETPTKTSEPVKPAETDAPAAATEAPAATEVPAANATEAPEDTSKKGCGSVIAGSMVAVLALAAIAIRKKEIF